MAEQTLANAGSITATLAPGAVDALAVLDTDAVSVRVRVPALGYDETQELGDDRTSLTFLDLPSDPTAQLLVTVTGKSEVLPVSVGTLMGGML
ncbi:MAG: hypothetical protein JSS15_04750, partial [Proteobacteria bacterium]|nr:hypothetical protein [Pseudomonadota bacterium]